MYLKLISPYQYVINICKLILMNIFCITLTEIKHSLWPSHQVHMVKMLGESLTHHLLLLLVVDSQGLLLLMRSGTRHSRYCLMLIMVMFSHWWCNGDLCISLMKMIWTFYDAFQLLRCIPGYSSGIP